MRSLALLCCILAVTGCDTVVLPTGDNSTKALTRYVDDENGVICYQAQTDPRNLSCVKVRDGVGK